MNCLARYYSFGPPVSIQTLYTNLIATLPGSPGKNRMDIARKDTKMGSMSYRVDTSAHANFQGI